ncbi:MAG: rRNA (uridine2479-2-O)-methyltransferase, partial [Actinomycetota bacterium]
LARASSVAHHELPVELFDHLADRDEPGELILVGAVRQRDLTEVVGDGPVLVLDRPSSPGNLGSLIRSADAFGAAGVVVLGHAADIYDPRAVRATVGSLFAVPVVELGGVADLAPWLESTGRRVLGLDERAGSPIAATKTPAALVLGSEARGLSVAARALCDEIVSIPMHAATATSLNLAIAGSIALYEVTR